MKRFHQSSHLTSTSEFLKKIGKWQIGQSQFEMYCRVARYKSNKKFKVKEIYASKVLCKDGYIGSKMKMGCHNEFGGCNS